MKLRINGNSIRLRLLRSEVSTFFATGRFEHTIHFAPSDDAFLTYGLEHEADLANVVVPHKQSEVTIVLPRQQAISWAETDQIGIHSAVNLGDRGVLDVIVEKDFACLDPSDADNHDTFPNPQVEAVCCAPLVGNAPELRPAQGYRRFNVETRFVPATLRHFWTLSSTDGSEPR